MFFDTVTLRKNGWYVKVLRFVFPKAPQYQNFCPFFWLTILACILSPFWALGKLIGFLFIGFIASVEAGVSWVDEHAIKEYEKNRENNFIDNLSQEDLYFAFNHYSKNLPFCDHEKYAKLLKTFQNLKYHDYFDIREKSQKLNESQFQAYLDSRKRLAELEVERVSIRIKAREERRQQKEKANREFHNKMIKFSKLIGPIIIGIVGLLVAYCLVMFLGWIWYWIWRAIQTHEFWVIVKEIGIIVSFVALLALVVYLIGKFLEISAVKSSERSYLRKERNCIVCQAIKQFFTTILDWLVRVFAHISDGFDFLIATVKMFKTNNCPGIVWKDDKK